MTVCFSRTGTEVNQLCRSAFLPSTMEKNSLRIVLVTGPTAPLPTLILSTERIGRDLGGGAGEEHLVGDVEHFARDHLLDHRNLQVARDLQDGIAGDARQHRIAQRRGQSVPLLTRKRFSPEPSLT